MVRVAATTVIMNADIAATSTFFTDGHNKASTLSRRLHSSSDTNGKQVNNQLIGTFDHNFEHENILSQISSSSSSSTTSNNSERSMQCIDSLFDQVVSFDSIPYVSGSNQINDCRIVARSSTYGNKTASPTVLRAKLYPHSVEGKDHCHRSSLTPDCSTQNAQLTPNTGTINTNTEQVHSNVYDAIDCIGGANNVATESPVTIPLSTTCSGTFVGWHELRNKLIKIKKANRRRQFRKRSLTLSLPLSRSKQQSSSSSSSSNVQDVNSDRISGNVRLLINRGLLNEFRNKFRRFGHNRSWNSRLCLNNSIPKKTSSSVNYSYSYYNFFYYPERQLLLERIGNHSSNIDSTIRSEYNQSTPICTGHCEANHHYQTKYCEQSSSLTSLLSIGSGTTVSETSSTLKCCNGNVNGILSSSPSINPYWWNANHVFIPYCSSDIWSGDSAAPNEMAFLGSRIIDEVISELIRSPIYRFVDAKFVLLAGSSAGAAGVMINLDRVARNIAESGSKADVRGLADSGWILENDYLEHIAAGKGAANKAPKQQTQQQSLPCTDAANCSPMESIRGAFKLWNSRVPTACTDRFPNEPWRCFFGYRLYPTLQTPLFVVQYQYDEFQIHVDGMTRGRVWNEHERLQYIRSLSDAIRYTLNNASVKGVTLPEALNCWEQTPIQINRFNGHNTMFQHQQHHHHHHHMHNKNGFHSNGKPINQYHQTTPSMKLFNSIYPYGIPVMSASGSNGNGNSGETEIENVDDDELSQYYSNGRAIHFGNYANTGQGSSSSANMPTSSKKSANNANYYNNLQLSDEMMSNDEPRKMSSTEIASTIQLKQSKNNSNGDENSIVVLNGTINSSLHKSLAISPTIVSNNNNNNKSLNQTNSGGGGGGSHSNNHQRKHDKRRKKRKRRKHSHRRFNSQTATSTISPITTVTSLLTNSIGNTKLKRNPMTKEENPIQPQNDQQSQLFHHGRSHAKKHRPNRMSMINPDGGRLPYNLNEPWKLSGGDDVEYHGYHHEPAQCRFRLIDDYTYPKTNTFACPSFYKD
ncbi:hypothetical protein RDWZM_005444 [Blomia tropicalis]|uniref:Uncharacterized protein n=1 Tax=Blomia tropicalis TaxID=40697 RepID=A0A9Q0M8G3_BLOTA|nr:hypothetical protein RDWZM_005444 [Blomia tropicalis]